ncbi:MAG TPA: YigZ family protein [Thermomicrobiales bacterium]|nr:YigZ family protein [Thermomicrobiales bacterium]
MEIPHRMIARDGQHEIEIRKSRFICSLFRVTTEDEARAHIDATRKQYWDANHNCTAWAIGSGLRLQRSSDDGEPSGTAGIPMLEVLRRREITDTLAIVTRYFGGIMLGAGGLIRAYGGAVSSAIDEIGVVERTPLQVLTLTASYDDAGRIEHAIRASDYPLENVGYTTDVTFELVMSPQRVAGFRHWIGELTNGAIDPVDAGTRFVEVPTTTEAPEPAGH